MRHIGFRRGFSGATSRGWFRSEPGVWATHGRMHKVEKKFASLSLPTILLSTVRQPGRRCLSQFYFLEVSHGRMNASLASKLEYLQKEKCHDYIWKYIRSKHDRHWKDTLFHYDILLVAEHLLESLVVMHYKLNLDASDVIFQSAKVSAKKRNLVRHPSIEEENDAVKNFISSNDFRTKNFNDFKLWEAANRTMWELLQIVPFYEEKVRELSDCIKYVHQNCALKPCLWRDNGCGYRCIESIQTRYL